jgi:hypothetical protein
MVFGLVAVLLTRLPKQAALSMTVLLGVLIFAALGALTYMERRSQNGSLP